MTIQISVVVCTNNPRADYLARVLAALRVQTLPLDRWELLVVDNASSPPLSQGIDLSWHSNGTIERAEELGLTQARLHGIAASRGELIVFVDDDNVVMPDYLQVALEIDAAWPVLGAWDGQCFPEFESPPPLWTRDYWHFLAINQFERDSWSNVEDSWEALPSGAGLCVRRAVAEAYLRSLAADELRRRLGRRGDSLAGGEDSDLAMTARDIGLGTGKFAALRLTHIIPARRLTEEYLLDLVQKLTASGLLLQYARGRPLPGPSRAQALLNWYQSLRLPARARRFEAARARGREAAVAEVRAFEFARQARSADTGSTQSSAPHTASVRSPR